jgi:hypothetical protein
MDLRFPYALFPGDADPLSAKTAAGIAHWRHHPQLSRSPIKHDSGSKEKS